MAMAGKRFGRSPGDTINYNRGGQRSVKWLAMKGPNPLYKPKARWSKTKKGWRKRPDFGKYLNHIARIVKAREPELKRHFQQGSGNTSTIYFNPANNQSIFNMADGILDIDQGTDDNQRVGDTILPGSMKIRITFQIVPAPIDAGNTVYRDRWVRILVLQYKDKFSIMGTPTISSLYPYDDLVYGHTNSMLEPEVERKGTIAVLVDKLVHYESPTRYGAIGEGANVTFQQYFNLTQTLLIKPKWSPTWESSSGTSVLNPIVVWFCASDNSAPGVRMGGVENTWRDNC